MRSDKFFGLSLAVIILASIFAYGKTSLAFESLPNSLTYQVVDTSKHELIAGVPTYYVQAGDSVGMTVTLRNRSTNPAGEVWYGTQDILPEGPSYPNAHAIGLGTSNPRDSHPDWIDSSSYVINNNRFMYYGADNYGNGGWAVYKGQDIVLHFSVKIASSAQPSTYKLYLAPVREFDNWGVRVTSTGAKYQYQDILWHFVVQGDTTLTHYNNTKFGYGFDYDKITTDSYGIRSNQWATAAEVANDIYYGDLGITNYTNAHSSDMSYVTGSLSAFANKVREINANDSDPAHVGKTVSAVQSGYLNTFVGFYFDVSRDFIASYDKGPNAGVVNTKPFDITHRYWAFQDKFGNNYLLNYPIKFESTYSRILNTIRIN